MNNLAELVREIVGSYIDEDKKYTGRNPNGYVLDDKAKAEKAKKLLSGHWVGDMLQAIEDSGE